MLSLCLLAVAVAVAITTPGVMITGGDSSDVSVEIYVPSRGAQCRLARTPYRYHGHAMAGPGQTVCGGKHTNSCVTFTDGNWTSSGELLEKRLGLVGWSSPEGPVMIGGYSSDLTTEMVNEGPNTFSFHLNFSLYWGCAIDLGPTVILVSGVSNRVAEFSLSGFERELPSLKQQRANAGCAYFRNEDQTKTYLVTGGYWTGDLASPPLASTELLREGSKAWVTAGQLPGQPRVNLRGVSVDNRVLMTGGYYTVDRSHQVFDDIVEFDPNTGQWKEVGRMLEKRDGHAMAVVDWNEIKQYCK